MLICMQQAHYQLCQQAQFSEDAIIFFSSGKSVVKAIKGKMKNKTKCNETLIARVVAMVDEDEWSTIQETAESFDKLC